MYISSYFQILNNTIFPPVCGIKDCGNRQWRNLPLCISCIKKFKKSDHSSCPHCGTPGCDASHREGETDYSEMHFLFYLTPDLSTVIHKLKYNSMKSYGKFLAGFIKYRPDLRNFISRFDALVPVPLHPLKKRERGYNQSMIIAEALNSITSIPVKNDILIRIRYTATQTRLTAQQRKKNISSAFQLKKDFNVINKRFLLVDDVFTTGSTAGECARVLKTGGALETGVFTLAHAGTIGNIDDFALELQLAGSFVC